MTPFQKCDWVHNALQEAINGCADEAMLQQALELVEDIREVFWLSESREDMTNALVAWDIQSVRDSLAIDDESFLDAVLRGDGWVPYSQLTDEQLRVEYEERKEVDA